MMPEQGNKPNPGTAAVISFIFTGLGQIYNGQIKKGLFIVFLSSLNMLSFVIGAVILGSWLMGKIAVGRLLFIGMGMFLAGMALIMVLGVYSIFDAYRVAAKK